MKRLLRDLVAAFAVALVAAVANASAVAYT
ncbi:hypothetical protein JOE26_002685 [Rhodococcus coprophilus]|nr:hypothetical protein [Rhodococcus coprophilus]